MAGIDFNTIMELRKRSSKAPTGNNQSSTRPNSGPSVGAIQRRASSNNKRTPGMAVPRSIQKNPGQTIQYTIQKSPMVPMNPGPAAFIKKLPPEIARLAVKYGRL